MSTPEALRALADRVEAGESGREIIEKLARHKAGCDLDADLLRCLVDYDKDTGIMTWRPRPIRPGMEAQDNSWNVKFSGKELGTATYSQNARYTKYKMTRISGRPYKVHRLIWLYVTGKWPNHWIDHSDGDGLNNRWNNLRDATISQNGWNARLNIRNKCGLKGVSKHRNGGKYYSRIKVNGKHINLGTFDTAEAAHYAFIGASAVVHGAFQNASGQRAPNNHEETSDAD